MRFVAATAVVLHHYEHKRELFPAWVHSFGYQAVTFFFMLSGFILTYVHSNTENQVTSSLNVSNRKFWTLRIARIFPA
jgi:peptidoglycan/LPS O-acetylase OafA/YrhL